MYLDEFVNSSNRKILKYPEAFGYLEERGFNREDIKKYGFGYTKVAKIKKEDTKEYRDFHRRTYMFKNLEGRIIIPLRNLIGRVNGLIVRSIEEKKYNVYLLNEAKKIGAFFGLYEAIPHIIRTNKVFVHEAAFDSASFAKVFPNSVSTITSFVNNDQYDTLRMLADKLILVFDEDKTGIEGRDRVIDLYGSKHVDSVSIGYNDSNSCLQLKGVEGFKQYIKRRIPLLLQQ